MGNQDHSYECETCAEMRGGMNDYVCACDRAITNPITNPAPIEHGLVMDAHPPMINSRKLRVLAANLAVGGALCASWTRGHNVGFDVGWYDARYHCLGMNTMEPSDRWRPGCGRAWGGGE